VTIKVFDDWKQIHPAISAIEKHASEPAGGHA